MTIELTKDSIDLGIVTRDPEAALRFYRDTLGFKYDSTMDMPGNGKMQRLYCGTSLIKIVTPGTLPKADAIPGGIGAATGFRYFTMLIANLDEMANKCQSAGYTVAVEPREIRPHVRIAIVEDPDGNWVEFVEDTNS